MYLKVPDRKVDGKVRDATLEEVAEAISTVNIQGLIVDMVLNYPCVEFPEPYKYSDLVLVQEHLENLGFEAY